jgi:oligoribonuclease NrnB/cAMP/cGMP phosphodiesterase (DHH superfamily)
MTKRIVIYHAHCSDGFTAAWVAWAKFGAAGTEYVAAHHGDPPPDVEGREVWVVDFSYPRATLLRMHEEASSLRVLDHHKTAQTALGDLPFVTFDLGRSGAGITWDEIFGGKRPWLVDYIEDRDLWRWALPDSRSVSAWIGAQEFTFAAWSDMNDAGVVAAVRHGKTIEIANRRQIADQIESCARRITLAGHDVPIINTNMHISETVGVLAKGEPFAIGWFVRKDGVYQYSLRSDEHGLDVSEIAAEFGGAGHPHAAGFSLGDFLE